MHNKVSSFLGFVGFGCCLSVCHCWVNSLVRYDQLIVTMCRQVWLILGELSCWVSSLVRSHLTTQRVVSAQNEQVVCERRKISQAASEQIAGNHKPQ